MIQNNPVTTEDIKLAQMIFWTENWGFERQDKKAKANPCYWKRSQKILSNLNTILHYASKESGLSFVTNVSPTLYFHSTICTAILQKFFLQH